MKNRKWACIPMAILIALMILSLAACGATDTKKSQGEPEWIYADVEDDETACVVVKYNGFDTGVRIPAENDGKKVTAIGKGAFENNETMLTITVPETVTSIGESAFRNCAGLKSFYVGANVTAIGAGAFASCAELRTFTVDRDNSRYVVDNNCILDPTTGALCATCRGSKMPSETPYSVIGAYAFAGSPLLEAVRLESQGKTINAAGLAEAVIPDTVREIGDGAFSDCPKLTSAVVPGFVTEVGDDLFTGSPVKEISLYKNGLKCLTKWETEGITLLGATEIDAQDFNNFTALKTLVLPETVTRIAAGAFKGCGALESITLPFVGGYKTAAKGTDENAFGYIFGREPYDGGVGVSQLRGIEDEKESYSLFYIPKNLKNVTVLGGDVGYGAFYNCKSIETVELNAQNVGEYAFTYCENLKNIRFSSALQEIGVQAFYQCRSLRQVKLFAVGENAYDTCVGVWCNVTFGNNYANPLSYGNSFVVNDTTIGELVIPSAVTEIKGYAFYHCESLTSIVIPETVTFVGEYAFIGCSGIREITNHSTVVIVTE